MCVCVCVCVCDGLRLLKNIINCVLVVPCCESVGKKGICLVEVYTGLCEMFPLVCLEGEKILLVVKEGLMKVLMKHCRVCIFSLCVCVGGGGARLMCVFVLVFVHTSGSICTY